MTNEKQLHSLISIEDFKELTGVDDRDDKLTRFSLVTSTLTIEQYCKRHLVKRNHFEVIDFFGNLVLPLRDYPVSKMLAVYTYNDEQLLKDNGEILEPDFYSVIPDCKINEDIPFNLSLSRALLRYRGLVAIKAVYQAGYSPGYVPSDLAAACMELASWNLNRYRGRRIGMTGNIKGSGKEGEHFELSLPENVRSLLEPYRRKTI